METLEEFALNFDGKPVPVALIKLLEFQIETGFESYCEGFGLYRDDKGGLKNGWSANPDFLARLMPFAQANAGGSFYAIWQYDDAVPIDALPVVLFGDEGGEFVVAEDIYAFLCLLTLDTEPMTYQEVSYYKDEDDDRTEYSGEYRNWLKKHFNLDAIDDENEILAPAIEKYQSRFHSWLALYLG
ncbi:MAG TPA: hypothetical protein VM187_13510 [Niastella sp.]|nr:hypothetical protein [Niastella sp.]